MRILSLTVFIVTLLYSTIAIGTQIAPKSLQVVSDESTIVLVGVVDHLDRVSSSSNDGVLYLAHVKIVSYLKGRSDATKFELPLHVGGLMGFDTELAEGDQAVFFLRSMDGGTAKLHSWGSVAQLPAGYFYVD